MKYGIIAAFLLVSLLQTPRAAMAQDAASRRDSPGQAEQQLHIQTGHTDIVTAIAVSHDGHLIATAGRDKTVRLWDVATGRELRTLDRYEGKPFHEQPEAVALSPDGKWLAMEMWGAPLIWDLRTGQMVNALIKHVPSKTLFSPEFGLLTSFPNLNAFLVYSPDGTMLAEGQGRAVALWEMPSGDLARIFPDATCQDTALAYAPDGKQLALGCGDGRIKILDPTSGQVEGVWTAGHTAVNALAFSSDNRWMASETADGKIQIWNASTGQLRRTLTDLAAGAAAIAFGPDNRELISASINLGSWPPPTAAYHDIRVWDFRKGALIETLKAQSGPVSAFVVSPSGGWLLSTGEDRAIKLWSTRDWKLIRILQPETPWLWITKFALSPNGRWVASEANNTAHLWDLASGASPYSFLLPKTYITDLAFSADSQKLMVADPSHVTAWDPRTGMQIGSSNLPPIPPRANLSADVFGPGASWLIYSLTDSGFIDVCDSQTGKILAKVPTEKQSGFEVLLPAVSPDGRWLVWPSGDGGLNVWDLKLKRPAPGIPGSVAQNPDALRLSPDGRWLAWQTSGGELKVWDLQDERAGPTLVARQNAWDPRLPPPAPRSGRAAFAFSTHGRRLAAAVGGFLTPVNPSAATSVRNFQGIEVWDVGTWNKESSIATKDLPLESGLMFSPNGRFLAGWGTSGLSLWNLAIGKEIPIDSFSQYQDGIISAAFLADSRDLLTGSEDGTARLWEIDDGKLLLTLRSFGDRNDWMAVTPDGLFDGSQKSWKQILWRFNGDTFDVAPAEIFFNDYFYPGLLTDFLSGKHPHAPKNIAEIDRRQPRVRVSLVSKATAAQNQIASRTVVVRVHVAQAPADKRHHQGSGVRGVRLFRNGSLVKIWHGPVRLDKSGQATLDARVTIVAGENDLTAYGFNHDNIKSEDASLTITGADSLRRRGTLYILSIGIDQYADPSFELRYSDADAEAFAKDLAQQQVRLNDYGQVRAVTLLDGQATRDNILLALRRLAGTATGPLPAGAPPQLAQLNVAQPEDALFIYYAGHGTAQDARFYIIPHNLGYQGARDAIGARGMKLLLAHSISDLTLGQIFEKIDAGHIALVIDACNSGQALAASDWRRGPMNSKGLAQLAWEKGMDILTAAQGYQEARESNRLGHGLLTYALVEEGLDQRKASRNGGVVYLRNWLDYAVEEVPKLERGKDKDAAIGGRGVFTKHPYVAQQPRVFHRRESSPHPFVVAQRPS